MRWRMIPSRLFRSRWSALFWAGGVLWTAYDVATASAPDNAGKPAAQQDATGATVDNGDLAVLANALAN